MCICWLIIFSVLSNILFRLFRSSVVVCSFSYTLGIVKTYVHLRNVVGIVKVNFSEQKTEPHNRQWFELGYSFKTEALKSL
jgi:hypothetical protein